MTISENNAKRISLLVEVAKRQGSLVTLRELVPLLGETTTESELAEAFNTFPLLRSRFELRSGYVTEKSDSEGRISINRERRSREDAFRNISFAARFMPMLHLNPFSMLAISGSTSYLSASRSRDLDLFCVAPRGQMWLSLTQALILARVYRLTRPDAPQICFSCVMDEEYAERAFTNERSSLFARDALATIVMRGDGTYGSLIRGASWISSFYPEAYSMRRRQTTNAPSPRRRAGLFECLLDRMLFVMVGSFLRMKASVLNRRLARRQRSEGAFFVRAGFDHLLYESARYSKLRHIYSTVPIE